MSKSTTSTLTANCNPDRIPPELPGRVVIAWDCNGMTLRGTPHKARVFHEPPTAAGRAGRQVIQIRPDMGDLFWHRIVADLRKLTDWLTKYDRSEHDGALPFSVPAVPQSDSVLYVWARTQAENHRIDLVRADGLSLPLGDLDPSTPPARRLGSPLVFNVASVLYPVRVVAGELLDDDGRSVVGLTRYRDGIYLHASVPAQHRQRLLQHELYHAWCMEVPEPTDEERRADLYAKISEHFELDLNAQGGAATLKALQADDASDAGCMLAIA